MSSGPPVRRLTEPCRKSPAVEAAARVGTPPSARRGTASPPHRDPVRTRFPRPEGSGDTGAQTRNSVKDFFQGLEASSNTGSDEHLRSSIRYNRRTSVGFTDLMRVSDIVRAAEGKRLTYRRIAEARL
jgi:hypothetical protein